jgi:hypothetical protein
VSKRDGVRAVALKARLLDTARHVETLRTACAEFGADLDLERFTAAWTGHEPGRRIAAYAVQAGYENAVEGSVALARALCELEGWIGADREATVKRALRRLRDNGLGDPKALTRLRALHENRGRLHDGLPGTLPRDGREAASTRSRS